MRDSIDPRAGSRSAFIAQVTPYSATLGVAIVQAVGHLAGYAVTDVVFVSDQVAAHFFLMRKILVEPTDHTEACITSLRL